MVVLFLALPSFLEKYDGHLPSDRALRLILSMSTDFESAAQSAIEVFRASLHYAELLAATKTMSSKKMWLKMNHKG